MMPKPGQEVPGFHTVGISMSMQPHGPHMVPALNEANIEGFLLRGCGEDYYELDRLGTLYFVHDAKACLAYDLCDAIQTLAILRGHTTTTDYY